MVISGNLENTPFHEIVTIISDKTGILELWNLPGRRNYTLYIKRGNLRCLQLNGQFADPLQTKAHLLDIMSTKSAAFELRIAHFITPCDPALNWPLEKVLFSLTVVDDEIKFRTAELPPPNTRFKIRPDAAPAGKANVFWERAQPLLVGGTSAHELSQALEISENLACYYLAKLLGQGVIERDKS